MEELGRGAISRVFLARQPEFGEPLGCIEALVRLESGGSDSGVPCHGNIVPIFSLVQEIPATGLVAVCMPYLGSATLCDVLDRVFVSGVRNSSASVILNTARDFRPQSMPASEQCASDPMLAKGSYINGVLHLGNQIAHALAYAHAKGVLHRDLKPSNILVASSGKPMLLDFNLSFDPQVGEMRLGGTFAYAAPEHLQAICQPNSNVLSVDPRSDLFSLGVILYELLTGSPPFVPPPAESSKSRLLEIMLASQAAGPIPIQQRNPLVDYSVANTIDRCLRFDPARRPQTAEEMSALLLRCLSPSRRIVRWSKNKHPQLSLAAIALIAITCVVGWIILVRDPYSVREFREVPRG